MSALGGLFLGLAAGAAVGWGAASWRYAQERRRYGRFLSFISHELNTPLTAMNMTVLNFVRGVFGPISNDHDEWMRILAEQTHRLADLVGDLRDLIHLEFHRDFRLHMEKVDLREEASRAAETVESGLMRAGSRLEIDVPETLPRLWTDPDRFRRVLDNMLAHAKKFRRTGPIRLSAALIPENRVEVVVHFQGPVLHEDEVRRMLDLFFVVSRPKTTVLSSIGLGLGICREIIDRSGGSMGFEVGPTGDSRIRARVPAQPKTEP